MHFFKNIYGEHPYGYQYNYNLVLEFLDNVRPVDLDRFYQKNINPDQLVMSLSGDFDIEEMKNILVESFADWENNNIEVNSDYVNVDPQNHGKVILLNKEDATQAKIRIGYNFYSDKFPKKVAFLMGNRIFGSGSFNSRLMENLRSEKGYVYSINSQTEYHKYGGVYYVNLSVDPANSYQSIEAVKKEMNLIKSGKEPFTEKELFENVNLYNAIFPKAYKENIDIIDKIAYEVEIRDNSDQYINKFIEQYNGLEAEEVQKIFADELYPEIIMSVIVGPADKIAEVLKENNVDYDRVN
jgi:zinc protease